jgi:hypothetical protein
LKNKVFKWFNKLSLSYLTVKRLRCEKMSVVNFTQEAKNWVKFLSSVPSCYFIGDKSTGKNNEKFGEHCMKPSMKDFMQKTGWIYQEYACKYFNGTEGSCVNRDTCAFGHKYSPRWVKAKPKKSFETSLKKLSKCNTSDNDDVTVSSVSSVSEMSQTLNLVKISPVSSSTGIWSGVVQGYSVDPEIKTWEERLLKTKKKKSAFLEHPDYSNEHEKQQKKLAKLNEKIKKCETKIKSLKQDLLAEDSDSDDGW